MKKPLLVVGGTVLALGILYSVAPTLLTLGVTRPTDDNFSTYSYARQPFLTMNWQKAQYCSSLTSGLSKEVTRPSTNASGIHPNSVAFINIRDESYQDCLASNGMSDE